MFKKTFIPFILILSLSVYGQKKELKAVDKLVESQDYDTALNQLLSLESVIDGSELKYQAQYQFLAGKIYGSKKNFKAAFTAFDSAREIESENGSSKHTAEIDKLMNGLSLEAINKAIEENQNENYAEASDLLILVYNIDKENNTDYLYYAASSAVNGGNYDQALAFYQELRDLDYTGSVEKFYATENETGQEVELSAENYVLFKKLKEYSNFRTEMTESKLPEIIKNIALIYVQQKQNDLAIGAIKDARAANPLDVGLILTEANLYIQLGDKQKFADLMKEAIEKDPNNHILYFNLGVITAEQGDRAKARSYYESAIELDPSYAASYLNLAALILDGEPELVEKMNSLGNSRADNIKYEQLQKQREGLFLEAVPVLENLTEIDPSNVEALTTLKNIFGTIGDAANFKKMKEKLEALGQ
ncbi:MAG: tetratricopeptide repeat protein [Flavobacteriaceae bacterium]